MKTNQTKPTELVCPYCRVTNPPHEDWCTDPNKPTENWDTKSLDQTFAAMGLNWLQIKAIKQFIAKTLKEHDEKLVAEMEKEKENGYPLPDDYYDKTKIIGEQRAEAWNNAIDRAIEIVRGGEK